MSNFFLEIYGEEIPSYYQSWLEQNLSKQITTLLRSKKINFSTFSTYSTSRRVIILSNSLDEFSDKDEINIRGPRTSANKTSISGFLKSNNLRGISDLSRVIIKDKEYYLYKKIIQRKKTIEILKTGLPQIFSTLNWKKSMRWGDYEERWIRPIKNIICMMENRVIPFQFAGVKTGSSSLGNYYHSNKKIKFENTKKYFKQLEENNVIISRLKRIESIKSQIKKFCKKKKIEFEYNFHQLEKIANSVEYPNVFFGRFEKSFFKMPEFLAKCIISEKQDFFHFTGLHGKLANFFCFVSNISCDNEKLLVRGNEKVLKARFSDAIFFLEEDKKETLCQRLNNLKKIVFYENVGTLFDRANRIKKLTMIISKSLEFKITRDEQNHLQFSNCDLSTELVKEFPSLQGKVGGYYLSLVSGNKRLSRAFSEQYFNSFDESNKNTLSFILSLSQKLDSIYSFFLTKKKISGSGDPFGIRRALLGLIKITIDKDIDLDFLILFRKCREIFSEQGITEFVDENYLVDYFNKRIKVFFSELDYRYDLIEASLDNKNLNPYLINNKLLILSNFIDSSEGKEFLLAYKRLFSIVPKEFQTSEIELSLLKETEEIELFRLCAMTEKIFATKKWEVFIQTKNIISFTKPINEFLDKLKVNIEDIQLKKNRINLLIRCTEILNLFFKFYEIEKNEI